MTDRVGYNWEEVDENNEMSVEEHSFLLRFIVADIVFHVGVVVIFDCNCKQRSLGPMTLR